MDSGPHSRATQNSLCLDDGKGEKKMEESYNENPKMTRDGQIHIKIWGEEILLEERGDQWKVNFSRFEYNLSLNLGRMVALILQENLKDTITLKTF